MPMLQDASARDRLEEITTSAQRIASLLRFMADATGERVAAHIEMSAEVFTASLGDLADRLKHIERSLEDLALSGLTMGGQACN